MVKNLLNECSYRAMIGYFAAGSTMEQSDYVVDTQGFEGIQFIGSIGTVTAAGVIQVRPMHSTSTSTTDMVVMANAYSGTTASTTGMTNKLIISDIFKPTKRYMSVQLHRATQNCVINSVVAVLYGGHKLPISQSTAEPSGVIDSDQYTAVTT